jgi:hypothetical protein
MGLIGLPPNGLTFQPLDLSGPTFGDLLTSTLGNMGTSGDDLDQSAQDLAEMMAAYEADVTAETITDTLPDGAVFNATVAELTLLGIEIDLDQTMQSISDALEGLSIGISVLDILEQWLQVFFKWAFIIARDVSVLLSQSGGIGIPGIPIPIPGVGGPG